MKLKESPKINLKKITSQLRECDDASKILYEITPLIDEFRELHRMVYAINSWVMAAASCLSHLTNQTCLCADGGTFEPPCPSCAAKQLIKEIENS